MSATQDDNSTKDSLSTEEQLNDLRKKYVAADNVWKIASVVVLFLALVYVVLIFMKLLDISFYVDAIVAVVLLALMFFCIYLLPHFLKTSSKQKEYFAKYKEAYLKTTLENAFKDGEYSDYEKVSARDLTKITVLKKAKGAVANDCIRGQYKKIPFSRYDLALRYGKKKASSECVLIITELKTKIKSEVQIVENSFIIGGIEYEQPETFCKILSKDEKFNEKFEVFAQDQDDGEKLLKDKLINKLKKLDVGGPVAIFCDKNEMCLIIKKKKDPMEAPIHTPVKEKKALKEAEKEVENIKIWIELIDDCL